MPVTLTYPGVYIEEVQSGVRTITGVATSITAFIGRALRGPVDSDLASPVRIFSFAEYERIFGGLWAESTMSFAVYQYFLNGGSDALIVRIHNSALTGSASVPLSAGNAVFTAANPGGWAAHVRIRIDYDLDPDIVAVNPAGSMFNLKVKDLITGVTEAHRNVSITATHPRFISDVLRQSSTLLRGPAASLPSRPTASVATSAADPFNDATAVAMTVAAGPDGVAVSATQLYSGAGMQANKLGMYSLEKADLFNLLVIPPYATTTDLGKADWDAAVVYAKGRRAMVMIDAPSAWTSASSVTLLNAVTAVATRSENAALFFPRLNMSNPVRDNRIETFPPAGAVAGVLARTDAQRGVWKSPAGIDATINGVMALSVPLTDAENGPINQLGVNCLRSFPNIGSVVWGSRTLKGADALANEWKYLAVRRTALFLEESLYRGTQWVVFEPNDEPLWAQIRLNLGAFMQNLFRQGAFQGASPREAYFVKCDRETTTQNDINLGIVNIIVGFAPLKPAEFVVIKLQQMAGQIAA